MKIVTLVGVDNVIIPSNLVSIFLGVSDLQGVKISIFLLTADHRYNSAAATAQPVTD